MTRYRGTRAVIDLESLAHNIQQLRGALQKPEQFFCPMVKANAYGHGDIFISQKIEELGVKYLGVGLIEEGILLREAGIKAHILFFGINDHSGVGAIILHKLIPVISDWEQLKSFESLAPQNYPVHLKFDTGMHRLGFAITELTKLKAHFSGSSKLKLSGILTHLHTGEDAHSFTGTSFEQLKLFKKVEDNFQSFNPISHAMNSAGFLNFVKHKVDSLPAEVSKLQGVRPGLAIYGISPVKDSPLNLKPVMSLRSDIIKYHYVRKGEGVSYNQTWKAAKDSVIGVVPIGYADGYHRGLSNKAELIFRNQKVPLVGNVCMDYLMIDITGALGNDSIENLSHEEVTLFGASPSGLEIPAAELAQKSQTIVWEILTSVGVRVPRELRSSSGVKKKLNEVGA